jgi:hypothetical protein
MHRKIFSGLALFVLAIYVMHTRTDLPLETPKPLYDRVSALPFGSIRAGNNSARVLTRSGAEHGTDQETFDATAHVDASPLASSGDEHATDQVRSEDAAPMKAGASARSGAEHRTDQIEFDQAQYKIGGIGSDAVAMLR